MFILPNIRYTMLQPRSPWHMHINNIYIEHFHIKFEYIHHKLYTHIENLQYSFEYIVSNNTINKGQHYIKIVWAFDITFNKPYQLSLSGKAIIDLDKVETQTRFDMSLS